MQIVGAGTFDERDLLRDVREVSRKQRGRDLEALRGAIAVFGHRSDVLGKCRAFLKVLLTRSTITSWRSAYPFRRRHRSDAPSLRIPVGTCDPQDSTGLWRCRRPR